MSYRIIESMPNKVKVDAKPLNDINPEKLVNDIVASITHGWREISKNI